MTPYFICRVAIRPPALSASKTCRASRQRLHSTLLFHPGTPQAAFGVSIFLPRTARPVLHFVTPNKVAIVSPADHVIGHIIDKVLLRKFVPGRQALGAVGLFHVLAYQVFIVGRANSRDVADTWLAAGTGDVLLVGDQWLADTAGAVHRNVKLTGHRLLNQVGSRQVLDDEFDPGLSRLANDRLGPGIILTLGRSQGDWLARVTRFLQQTLCLLDVPLPLEAFASLPVGACRGPGEHGNADSEGGFLH